MKTLKLTDKQAQRLIKVLECSIKRSQRNIDGCDSLLRSNFIAWDDEQKAGIRAEAKKSETAKIEKEVILKMLKEQA